MSDTAFEQDEDRHLSRLESEHGTHDTPEPDCPRCQPGYVDPPERLPLIGRERFMIEKLAKALHGEARRCGAYTAVREIPRGNYFEVALADGRIARITVELDRVEEH